MNKFFSAFLVIILICASSPVLACTVTNSAFFKVKSPADVIQIVAWFKQLQLPVLRDSEDPLKFIIEDPSIITLPALGQTHRKIRGYAIPAHIKITGWGSQTTCK